MSNSPSKGTALVTGASAGIGEVYADRLAKGGYDLMLVARNKARLKALYAHLTSETGHYITPLPADLNRKAGLAKVETTMRDDQTITMTGTREGIFSEPTSTVFDLTGQARARCTPGSMSTSQCSHHPKPHRILMTTSTYAADRTALLIVDPYNDFMSEGGKLFEAIRETAAASGLFDNLRKLLPAVRAAGIQVFIVPHHRARQGDHEHWLHMNPMQVQSHKAQVFAVGTWGGEWHPEFGPQKGDVIVREHWAQSGFANTDLDAQLKQHGTQKIILVGMIANTCIESTGRFGMELGYHVTLVPDATAAFRAAGMHAAHEVNGPTFAHAILTTEALLTQLPHAPAGTQISTPA